jgi:hydrogenase maturation protease
LRRERHRPRKEDPVSRRPEKEERAPAILVLGIGNPGRTDDGLGIQAVERLEALALPGVTCDTDYQLNVEDALSCSRQDIVVFVDAARGLRVPFLWTAVKPKGSLPAMTHALGPETVLALCAALYGKRPRAHLLGIRGHRWNIGEGISTRGEKNLREAVCSLEAFVKRRRPKKGHVR